MIQAIGDESVRTQYRIDQLIEEAINSSLIEGAKLTTRALAKAMLRDGRTPASGRLRLASENVRVEDSATGETWFTPPPAHELKQRLEALLAFANQGPDVDGSFFHPLIRAIILHFWVAYLHPFVDGNGRMARPLFYWQMLRSGYDFAQYLSISGPIDRSKRAYYRSFVYTETDDGDLTYFLLNQLAVLSRATDELLSHLRDRSQRLREITSALSSSDTLNHRQQAVLSHLVRHPHPGATVTGHSKSHAVSYLTARKDLQQMMPELLQRRRIGKTDYYVPTERLLRKLVAERKSSS